MLNSISSTQSSISKRITAFKILTFSLSIVLAIPSALAFELPYGVQDPFKSPAFPSCEGGEMGYWQFLSRPIPNSKEVKVWLVLTTVDLLDPAFVVCYVPADRKVLVMERGKES